MINLANEIGVTRDMNARSLSYFCTQPTIEVSNDVVNQLLEVSKQNGNCDVRLSLHRDPDDDFHQMIILQYRGNYSRPHQHINKSESCHIMRGALAFIVFNDDGSIAQSSIVDKNNVFVFRCASDLWHTVIPISEYVVYHESKRGPYLQQDDSVFPNWAPHHSEIPDSLNYMENLLALIDGSES